MPRGYQPTPYTGPRTAQHAPGSPHAVEDALLKARQDILNLGRFTSEHFAAYAAFAGITDRSLALDLHRHHVTWDDVNDYAASRLVSASDYEAMKALRMASVTPRRLTRLDRFTAGHGITLTVQMAVLFGRHDLNPTQMEPWFAAGLAHLWTVPDLAAILGADGLTVDQVRQWHDPGGVADVDLLLWFHRNGCHPEAVGTWLRHTSGGLLRTPHRLRVLLSQALRTGLGIAAAQVAALRDADPDTVTAWAHTGLPTPRVVAYLSAGIAPTEWHTGIECRELDETTLHMMSALHPGPPIPASLLTAPQEALAPAV